MAKPLLQLDEETRNQLASLTEAGMGYYIVVGRLGYEGEPEVLIIGGDFYVIPFRHRFFFSLVDLAEGQVFPQEASEVAGVGNLRSATARESQLAAQSVSLPPGYTPAFGAIPLLGTTTLKFTTNFYRFVAPQTDPRFNGTILTKGTYLTSANDYGYANSGFAAVGRYALPLPVPARYLFGYQLPPGTTLLVGTVLPKYGQAGGGVEIKLPADTKVQRQPNMPIVLDVF